MSADAKAFCFAFAVGLAFIFPLLWRQQTHSYTLERLRITERVGPYRQGCEPRNTGMGPERREPVCDGEQR